MRTALISFFVLFLCSSTALAADLPSCQPDVFTRHGNSIDVSVESLQQVINQRLQKANSHFTNPQLAPQGNDTLKISGQKSGTPMSISGPVRAGGNGRVIVHAAHITKNGQGVKTMMDLFGKDLADYVDVNGTKTVSVQGDNLRINPGKLLHVAGHLQKVQLNGSTLQMIFASQPCR